MRTCEEYRTLISALIDDEISEGERSELMEHVAGCEDCKVYLDDQLIIHDAVQALTCAAPAGFADSVMARVHETKQEAPAKKVIAFPRWKQFAGLAACCAVIALGVFAMNGRNLSMDAAANSAAPEMAYSLEESAQYAADTTADDAAPEVPAAGMDGGAAEIPEQEPAEGARAKSEGDNGACVADAAPPYAEYGEIAEFAERITTGSEVAAQWVEETLGAEWESGSYYLLTAEEYGDLCRLLEEKGEAFSLTAGSEDSRLYQLLAE